MTTEPVFIRCRRCNQLCRLGGAGSGGAKSSGEIAGNEGRVLFLKQHDGHPLETLALLSEPQLLGDQKGALGAKALLEVTNGNERLLIEGRSRADGSHCLQFRVVTSEEIAACRRTVDLDTVQMRRELDQLFYPHVVPVARVNRFIHCVSEIITSAPQESFEIARAEGDRIVARPSPETVKAFYSCAKDVFATPEYEVVCRLITIMERGEQNSPLTPADNDEKACA